MRVYIPFTVGAHVLALFEGGAKLRPRLLKVSARVHTVKGAQVPKGLVLPFGNFCYMLHF